MFSAIWNACKSIFNRVKEAVKHWTKPATATLAVGAASDMTRSRRDLLVENAILRQQLIVLKRSVKRPKFTPGDRTRLTLLARLTNFWQSALHIVQPDTILRWHRDMFRRYWKRKSTPQSREPRIPRETIALIKQMARENPRWGTKKIYGELLKLEIVVDKRTIKKYIKQVRKHSGGQNWRTFLRNHAHEIWACDFTTIHTLFFKPLYVFVVMEHESRRIVHTAVTTNPTDAWTAQQVREATPWGKRPKYLIHDNDGKFGSQFKGLLRDSGIKAINTPPKAPRANALCERFMGSLERECTDNFLNFHQHHLQRIIATYADYFNKQRPHQGINQHIPERLHEPTPSPNYQLKGKVISTPVLNGLFHSYSYAHQLQ
jgi:transposase InsO family protein